MRQSVIYVIFVNICIICNESFHPLEHFSRSLHILLVLSLLEVLLEPGHQVPCRGKLLLVEVEARTLDLYQFLYWLLVLVHVDQ